MGLSARRHRLWRDHTREARGPVQRGRPPPPRRGRLPFPSSGEGAGGGAGSRGEGRGRARGRPGGPPAPRPPRLEAAPVAYVSRNGQQVTIVGGEFTRQSGTGAPSAPTPILNLGPAAQAAILDAGNASTANVPELTGFNVTIIPSSQDVLLVQTATGPRPVVGGPGPVTTTGWTPSGTAGVGRDILANQSQPVCTASSLTTCP